MLLSLIAGATAAAIDIGAILADTCVESLLGITERYYYD